MGTTPRIRLDLQVSSVDEGGSTFYDVVEPRSGQAVRMYEFEWLIARRLDGSVSFDELAAWAREQLSVQVDAAGLETFAERLREMGFFDEGAPLTPPVEAMPPAATTPGDSVAHATNGAAHATNGAAAHATNGAAAHATDGAAAHTIDGAATHGTDGAATHATDGAAAHATANAVPSTSELGAGPAPAPAPEALLATGGEARPAAKPDPARLQALAHTMKKPAAEEPDVARMKEFFRKAPLADEDAPARLRRGPTISSSVVSAIGIVSVTAALPLIIYFSFIREAPPAQVHVTQAKPEDVLELYDGEAKVTRGVPRELSFSVDGTVAQVSPVGTTASARTPLAALAERAQTEAELTHLQHRQEHYEKLLAEAQASGDQAKITEAEKKVAEKKKLIADAEAKLQKTQLLAPEAGSVLTVNAPAGTHVAAGQPVVTLGDARLHAVFHLPAFDASSMGDGATVQLQTDNGRLVKGQAAKVQGEQVIVDVDPSSGLKEGDAVRLVHASVHGLVRVPEAAVVRRGGVNTVFVLKHGEAQARTVTLYDRQGEVARITKGLDSGDQVIVDPTPTLQNGDRAETPE